MRVLLYTFSFPPKVDGVVSRVLNTVKWLHRDGHDVRIATCQDPVASPGWVREAGIQIDHWAGVRLPAYRAQWIGNPINPRLWLQVRRSLASFRPEVVHLIGPDPGHYAIVAMCARAQLPVFFSYHTDVMSYARAFGVPPRLVYWLESGYRWRWIDRIVTTSEPFRHSLVAEHRIPCHGVWPPGVDTDLFHPREPDPELRSVLTRGAKNRFLFLYVGRFSKEKDLPFLIRLMAAIPQATLALIGEGPDTSWQRELPGHFFQSGGFWSAEKVARAYSCADAFITASCTETCGFSVLEATASGLPVIAPAAQGLLSTVVDEQTGLLFAPHDKRDARRQVDRLVHDEPLRARLRQGALAARAALSWPAATRWLVDQYTQIIGARAAARGNRAP